MLTIFKVLLLRKMDVLIAPAFDILKYHIKKTYLSEGDNDFNMLMQVFLSALLAYMSKYIPYILLEIIFFHINGFIGL